MTRDVAQHLCNFPRLDGIDISGMEEINIRLKRRIDALEADPTEAALILFDQRTLGDRLSRTSDLDEIAELCLETALEVDAMDCGGVYLLDDDGVLRLSASVGLPDSFVLQATEYCKGSLNYQWVMDGEPLYLMRDDLAFAELGEPVASEALGVLAVIPFRTDGRVVGCFNVASHTAESFPKIVRVALECISFQLADVVARALAHRRLQEACDRYQALAQAGFESILVHRGYEVVASNGAWTRLTGWSADETVERGVLGVFAPDCVPTVSRAVECGLLGQYEAEVLRRDGSTVPVEVAVQEVSYNGRAGRCRAKVITPLAIVGDSDVG